MTSKKQIEYIDILQGENGLLVLDIRCPPRRFTSAPPGTWNIVSGGSKALVARSGVRPHP